MNINTLLTIIWTLILIKMLKTRKIDKEFWYEKGRNDGWTQGWDDYRVAKNTHSQSKHDEHRDVT